MSETVTKTQVLIVGAGPTGLALAVQLIRYGIDFMIVDQKEDTTPYSKAIGVQARTLEIYQQIDRADALVQLGAIVKGVRLVEGGEQKVEVPLSTLGQGMSAYPFVLIVEQGKHERVLYKYIQAHGREVRWQTTLAEFSQNDDGVTGILVNGDGEREVVQAQYLAGCDGAKSHIRKHLGLTFAGSTFQRLAYVADVQLKWQFQHDMLTTCVGKHSATAFFPMVGADHYRTVGLFPEHTELREGEVLYEEIERQIVEDTKLQLDIYKVNWFSTYKVHSRRVNKFSEGRCFLAGDAAHIHSPIGAQGMNTGIQDGYNLAWKLALVLRGKASSRLLDTYNEERIEIAKRLLETTDRMFDLVVNPAWWVSFVRRYVFPRVAGLVVSMDSVNQFIFPLISQIGITYRESSLSLDTGEDFEVKAGDRMPYLLLDGTDVYDSLKEPSFHLLSFSGEPAGTELRREISEQFPNLVDYHEFPFSRNVSEHFNSEKPFHILLRPDNYLAFVSAKDPIAQLRDYFARIIEQR